jgi:hypothetical protein
MSQDRVRCASFVLVAVAACGDNVVGTLTPEQAATQASGTKVTVFGTVHTVTWDSTQTAMRKRELAAHAGDLEWILEQDGEEERGDHHAYDDGGAKYPRTPDHYILIRSAVPAGITFDAPDFTPGKLAEAWTLGIHLTEPLDPAAPLPEVGARVKVIGTIQRIAWNQREIKVPIVEPTELDVIDGPPTGLPPGATCALDQECNARLVCDRASRTCMPPPREIYWADPLHDVNGACDVDDDCPLGQTCDARFAIAGTGPFAASYFKSTDVGRHVCRLPPDATVASQCPRIYTTRDLAGARFVTGKEICVRATLMVATQATDGDTHDQMQVDEPIPYPTDDVPYHLFGATTENGPPYKDPSAPAGAIPDPQVGQEVIAIGTYRYDPDHGWHEVHPVKAYLTP